MRASARECVAADSSSSRRMSVAKQKANKRQQHNSASSYITNAGNRKTEKTKKAAAASDTCACVLAPSPATLPLLIDSFINETYGRCCCCCCHARSYAVARRCLPGSYNNKRFLLPGIGTTVICSSPSLANWVCGGVDSYIIEVCVLCLTVFCFCFRLWLSW